MTKNSVVSGRELKLGCVCVISWISEGSVSVSEGKFMALCWVSGLNELLFYLCQEMIITCVSPVCVQVRAELQTCVSRQQEALRCREVWLLSQIELLEQLKTETLQQQLHQLHRVITHNQPVNIPYLLTSMHFCYVLNPLLFIFCSY